MAFGRTTSPSATTVPGPSTAMPQLSGSAALSGGAPTCAKRPMRHFSHGICHARALADGGVIAQDAVFHLATHVAALGDGAVADVGVRPDERWRAGGCAAVDRPAPVEQIQPRARREHIHVRVPETVERADILPVSLEAVGGHLLARGQHGRDDVLAEVVFRCGVSLVGDEVRAEFAPREDVDAHGGEVALRLARLLGELRDEVIFVHGHDAEAARLLPRHLHHRDRTGCTCLPVAPEHL